MAMLAERAAEAAVLKEAGGGMCMLDETADIDARRHEAFGRVQMLLLCADERFDQLRRRYGEALRAVDVRGFAGDLRQRADKRAVAVAGSVMDMADTAVSRAGARQQALARRVVSDIARLGMRVRFHSAHGSVPGITDQKHRRKAGRIAGDQHNKDRHKRDDSAPRLPVEMFIQKFGCPIADHVRHLFLCSFICGDRNKPPPKQFINIIIML